MITFMLCNVFEQIWYSESILVCITKLRVLSSFDWRHILGLKDSFMKGKFQSSVYEVKVYFLINNKHVDAHDFTVFSPTSHFCKS